MKFLLVFSALLAMVHADGGAADARLCTQAQQNDCTQKDRAAQRRRPAPRWGVPDQPRALPPSVGVPSAMESGAAQSSVPGAIAPRATPPTAPLPVTSCDPGGCWGSSGARYSGGAGGAYSDSSGRLCQRNGAWMQCF